MFTNENVLQSRFVFKLKKWRLNTKIGKCMKIIVEAITVFRLKNDLDIRYPDISRLKFSCLIIHVSKCSHLQVEFRDFSDNLCINTKRIYQCTDIKLPGSVQVTSLFIIFNMHKNCYEKLII